MKLEIIFSIHQILANTVYSLETADTQELDKYENFDTFMLAESPHVIVGRRDESYPKIIFPLGPPLSG